MTALARMVLMICAGQAFALQDESGERPSFSPPLGPAVATVTFTMSLPQENPLYYSVSVGSMGTTSYYSRPNSDLRTGEPFVVEFTASRAIRTTIFRLAGQLRFFHGNFKTRQSAHTRTGWKSLTFAERPINNRISYTSRQNALINRLMSLSESISATMEGRWLGLLEATQSRRIVARIETHEATGQSWTTGGGRGYGSRPAKCRI